VRAKRAAKDKIARLDSGATAAIAAEIDYLGVQTYTFRSTNMPSIGFARARRRRLSMRAPDA